MKRLMIGALAMTLILSGCGRKDAQMETTVPTETTVVTEVTAATTLPETEPPATTEAPTETEVQEPTIPETEAPTEPAGDPGIVVRASKLNVRKTPGMDGELVKQIPSGTRVMILEQQIVSGMIWGRTEDGWVSMNYIQLEDSAADRDNQKDLTVPQNEKPSAPEKQPSDQINPTDPTEVPTVPHRPSPEDRPVPENSQVPEQPEVPEASGPSKPVAPKPSEPQHEPQEETEPAVHQHHWIPVSNQAGTYAYDNYVTCSCGARFSSADAWAAHRDTFLNSEEILNHTGYASGSDKIEITPPQTTWQCDGCGATQTLDSSANP